MAARDESGGSNLIPIVGGLVVGAGIVALIYKMFFMEDGMSTAISPAEPIIAEKEKDIEDEPAKEKGQWPCPQSIPQGPCSNPYDRRQPYCQ